MDTLPLELLDLIVEHLSDGGGTGRPRKNSSLHSCSLVSTKFRAPCQKLFYKSIALTSRAEGGRGVFGPYTFVEALAHFDASPHLVPYVSALDLSLDGDASELEDRAWLKNDVAFAVLSKFTNVSSCEFINEGPDCYWEHVPEEVKSAFLAWLALPLVRTTLRRVWGYGFVDLPLALVEALLSTASELTLESIGVAASSTIPSPARRANTRDLEKLALTSCFPTSVNLMQSPAILPYLKNLRSIRLHADMGMLSTLCEVAADALEHISLVYPDPEFFPFSQPPTMSRLAHFTFRFAPGTIDETGDPETAATFFVSQIQTILSSAPALSELELQVDIESNGILAPPAHHQAICRCLFPARHMKALDAPCADHIALKRARFSLCSSAGAGLKGHRKAFRNSIREAFPKTLQKGRLQVGVE
uniref:F-box domain-containing protein n=1 Tax=Mycena chlorophos TaxID=658473 RepID=A0ABQ0L370_MYCCL|nr:predicted protein [Mycena chlorophos]